MAYSTQTIVKTNKWEQFLMVKGLKLIYMHIVLNVPAHMQITNSLGL